MEMPWVQVVCITAFSILDVGTALYYRYVTEEEQKVRGSLFISLCKF